MTNPHLRPLSTLCIVVAAMSALLLGCSARTGPETAWKGLIKIGIVLPFSGYDANSGERALWGARMAANELNLKGGISGWRLELVSLDDGNDAETAAARARELVADPQVIAAIGHPGLAAAMSAAPVYASAALPCVAFGLGAGTAPKDYDPYVRGVGSSPDAIGDLLAKWLNSLPTRPATVILTDSDPAAKSVGSAIHSILLRKVTLSSGQEAALGTPTASNVVSRTDSIVLFAGGLTEIPDTNYFAGRARYVALFEADTPAFSSLTRASGQEWFYVSREPVSASSFAAFAARFQTAFGMSPTVYSALAYDTVMAIASEVEAGVSEGRAPSRANAPLLAGDRAETPGWAGALPRSLDTPTPVVLRSVGAAYPGPLVYPQP